MNTLKSWLFAFAFMGMWAAASAIGQIITGDKY